MASRFLNRISVRRRPSPIRALQPLTQLEGMISFGSGMPAPSTFPIAQISATLTDGSTISIGPAHTREAMQYSATNGLPRLQAWVSRLLQREHGWDPSSAHGAVCVTTGSQNALHLAFEMLLDEEAAVLLDEYAYPGAIESIRPLGARLLGVAADAEGMRPERLVAAIEASAARGVRPRVLYTVPTGHNPCGFTMPTSRRREIYQICSQYDLLILEDDPYWFLDLSCAAAAPPLESFLRIDTQQRVLRFDSLSKVLSSGIRVGWVSGPSELVERISLHQQVAALHSSGPSQALVLALLEAWGEEGWRRHVASVQQFYRSQRDVMAASAARHLGELARWHVPTHGMFLWMDLSPSGVQDTHHLVTQSAVAAKVLLVPGSSFAADGAAASPSPYVRAAFSMASAEDMEEGMARIATMLTGGGGLRNAPSEGV
ncbi:hypothetical protein AB1Y20_011510 [Prymnesium parvum]|uniref:Aminotransferase class I/classII large domain-containing protein n=1 Tax=Prymnesium parvum TaxID=97485 RepID=A0AB34IJ92_PRYPA